jgi:hypothetical protein
MAARATDSEHGQEAFPFMRLPAEIRLMIYERALHDITDPIMFPGSGYARKPQPDRGVLALLRTSKHVRQESTKFLWPITCDLTLAILDADDHETETKDDDESCDQILDRLERRDRQYESMRAIEGAFYNAKRAYSAALCALMMENFAKLNTRGQ